MKILIVDDSRISRKIVSKELEDAGYQILEASDGSLALELLRTDDQIRLVTLDVNMPGMNGYEVCAELRRRELEHNHAGQITRVMPVIFVTVSDTLEERMKGFRAGATEFINKGFNKCELLQIVDRILKPHNRMTGLTVLVVEDNDLMRSMLVSFLAEYGVFVIEAQTGEEAYEIARDGNRHIDLVVADLELPGGGGRQLCQLIRKELNMDEMPIIIITNAADRAQVLDLYKAGATDYLVKPLVREEVFAKFNVFLEVILLTRQLRAKVRELEEMNQLKDEFLSVCSHDFKSPLTGILGIAELLAEDTTMTASQRELVQYLDNSGRLLMHLTNDLSDLMQIQSWDRPLKLEPVDLVPLVEESLKVARFPAQPKRLTLKFENRAEKAWIYGDASAMKRVFNNLLSNAVKFTPEEGEVMILLEAGGGDVYLVVGDTGVGIPDRDLPLLFDKYSKKSRRGTAGERGTGLGLPIVKMLVEKQNGAIAVSSMVGEGTRIELRFPEYLRV